MKAYFYYLFAGLFVLSFSCMAEQRSRVDSILPILDRAREDDTLKVDVMQTLSEAYDNEGNLEKGKYYAEEALALSKRLNYKRGQAKSMITIAIRLVKSGDYKEAVDLLNTALEWSEKNDLKTHIANVYYVMGVVHDLQGDYTKSMDFFLKALELWKRLNNKERIAITLNSIGSIHQAQSNYDSALKYCLDALAIKEEIEGYNGEAFSLTNIAQILMDLKDYKEALVYFEKGLQLFKKRGDKRNQANILNNMGIIYDAWNEDDKSEQYHLQSLKLQEELGNKSGITSSLGNIGGLYEERQDYERALEFYFKALSIQRQMNDRDGEAITLHRFSQLYMHQKKYDLAIRYAYKSLQLARAINRRELIKIVFQRLAACYDLKGDYAKALEYSQRYVGIKDSILNEESSRQIADMRTRFETAEKEKENELLKKESEKQSIEIKQRRTQRNASIAGLFLVVLLSFVWIRTYRQKLKAREQLMAKNEELNRQKSLQLLKEQELKTIKSYLEGQENERKRIAQDFHDGVGGALAAIRMNLMKVKTDESNKPILQKALGNLNKTYEEVRTISHHLTPPGLFRFAFTEVLKKFIDDLITSSDLNIRLHCEQEDELNALGQGVQTDVYRIIQELLNNVVKYADATRVDITLHLDKEQLSLKVADNGQGFHIQKKRKGIGLSNIQSRVESLQGQFHIHSEPGAGTKAHIEIPYKVPVTATIS